MWWKSEFLFLKSELLRALDASRRLASIGRIASGWVEASDGGNQKTRIIIFWAVYNRLAAVWAAAY
jgi:hypothetical protein